MINTISKQDNIIVEAVALSLLTLCITSVAIETVNRNKPEGKSQEQKLTEFSVQLVLGVSMYIISKKIFKS